MSRTAAVLTVSDGCARGEREDISGVALADGLIAAGFAIVERVVVPDEVEAITSRLIGWRDAGIELVMTTGGTGFATRDVTPDATAELIEREAPGLAELLRWTGYQKLPRAVLSRGVAGIAGRTLIINLAGSPGAVRDGLEVLLPILPHAIAVIRDEPVDHGPGASSAVSAVDSTQGKVVQIETNLDDCSPELFDPLMERLFETGAVDVFMTPAQMKKNRPATLLSVLAPPDRLEAIADVIFADTTTFGLRYSLLNRFTLERRWETVETEYGPIRIKIGAWRGEDRVASPEFEDVRNASRAKRVPAREVYSAAQRAYRSHADRDVPPADID